MRSGRAQQSGGSVNELAKNFTHMKTLREDKLQPKEQAVDVIALLKAHYRSTTAPTPRLPQRIVDKRQINFKQEPIVVPPDVRR